MMQTKEKCMACDTCQEYYFYPLTPQCEENYVDRNKQRSIETPQTKYPMFTLYAVRLASFDHYWLHCDPKVFAQQGLFYKWPEYIVCCYECGFVLCNLSKEDSLLRHFQYSPECRHLATIVDQTFLRAFKVQLQRPEANASSSKEAGERETISSQYSEKKIRSPEYSSYNKRLSTFKRFPQTEGLNINEMADAGFYYKGLGDQVWCYACGNGLRKWEPGEEPWEEHYKWIPDCPHLKQSGYKPQKMERNPDESSINVKDIV